jgi:hypothetical protein
VGSNPTGYACMYQTLRRVQYYCSGLFLLMGISWGFSDDSFKIENAGLVILTGCLLSIGSICNYLLLNIEQNNNQNDVKRKRCLKTL